MRAGNGSVMAVAFIGVFLVYGSVLGGQFQQWTSLAGSSLGFQVRQVIITGQKQTTERAVLRQLRVADGRSLLGLDVAEARTQLLELPWVQAATVRKVYPDSLKVELEEKQPFAVWQSQEKLTVVERSGKMIARFSGRDYLENRFSYLPRIVGEGAEIEAVNFIPVIAAYPSLAAQAETYVRVSGRRWDIRFRNGKIARLPERNLAQAVEMLAELERQRDVLARDIEVIDLRLPDRIVFRLADEASLKRKLFVEQRAQEIKILEKRI